MSFEELKIGYVPYQSDLSAPGDRRRFPYFAKRNNVKFEVADADNLYDVILLTAVTSNLSKWIAYKGKHPNTRFIFEMTDSLILTSDVFRTLFKGIGRFILGRESSLYLNYKVPIIKWLKMADIVICSSTKMTKIISKWNRNVVVSLDYTQNEIKTIKSDYNIKGKMKLVWEGQTPGLINLLTLKKVLKQVNSFCELHIITDEQHHDYGNILTKGVFNLLKGLPITTVFHKWELYKNYEILSSCDCGIIPLNRNNKMAWHKPANKLMSFWFAGVPTIVSDTPAYTEMMKDAGTDLYCSDDEEWISGIKKIYEMTSVERKNLAEENLRYVKTFYSNEALDTAWFEIFEKLEMIS
jgi:glycosyltransferase involved in cell wall biosynthesis